LQYLAANFIAPLGPAQNIDFIYHDLCVCGGLSCQQIGKRNCCPLKKKEKPAKKPALGTITLIANQPEIDQNYQ